MIQDDEYDLAPAEEKEAIIDKLVLKKNTYTDGIEESELEYVSAFFDRFIFDTGGKHVAQVDLKLILKALPSRVDETNCRRVELFNFDSIRNAIINNNNSQ